MGDKHSHHRFLPPPAAGQRHHALTAAQRRYIANVNGFTAVLKASNQHVICTNSSLDTAIG